MAACSRGRDDHTVRGVTQLGLAYGLALLLVKVLVWDQGDRTMRSLSDWEVGGAFFSKDAPRAPRHLDVIVDKLDDGAVVVVSVTTGKDGHGGVITNKHWRKISRPSQAGLRTVITREQQNLLDGLVYFQWTERAPREVIDILKSAF